MTILRRMSGSELEALAAKLHAQMARGAGDSESGEIELKDVKDWVALHEKEAESSPEHVFFLNLL